MVSPKGLVSAGVGVIGIVLPMIYPEISPWLGWPIVIAASLAVIYGLYQMFGLGWVPSRRMLITDAAALMWNKCGPGLRDLVIQTTELSRPGTTLVSYFESALTVLARGGIVKLYGRREPKLGYEAIPKEYFSKTTQVKENALFDMFNDKRMADWHEVRVARSEAIKGLKEFEIDEVRQRLR